MDRAFTTGIVAGVLVLLVTVLIVNEVLSIRDVNDRARATAAQAAIVMGQAARTSKAVSSALDGSGERDNASDEVRTFMTMLLIVAPVLIDSDVPRNVLEKAQHLGGEMVRALATMAKTPGDATASRARLDEAVDQLQKASSPLLHVLNSQQRTAASGPESTQTSPSS